MKTGGDRRKVAGSRQPVDVKLATSCQLPTADDDFDSRSPVIVLPTIDRRTFLATGSLAGLSVLGLVVRSSPAVDLESLREEVGDRPGVLVDRARARGFRVVRDETVLSRPAEWQDELGRALAARAMRLAAIEAVVDFGSVTFAGDPLIAGIDVLARLDRAIGSAGRLRCAELIAVPGRAADDVPASVTRSRIVALLTVCADRCRRARMQLLVEPIDRGPDHPRMAVPNPAAAIDLCRGVGRANCRVVGKHSGLAGRGS